MAEFTALILIMLKFEYEVHYKTTFPPLTGDNNKTVSIQIRKPYCKRVVLIISNKMRAQNDINH